MSTSIHIVHGSLAEARKEPVLRPRTEHSSARDNRSRFLLHEKEPQSEERMCRQDEEFKQRQREIEAAIARLSQGVGYGNVERAI